MKLRGYVKVYKRNIYNINEVFVMNKSRDFITAKIKSPFWRALFAPFEAFRFHKLELFIWFAFVLVASLLGVIINLIKRVGFDGWNICVALGPDSAAGSFYTFSMVMFSSLIYPLFSRFISGDKPEYRRIHIAYITVLIFVMLFCGVYYSFSTLDQPMVDYSKLHKSDMEFDCPQFFFFILALVFSVYSFGLTLIGQHEDVLHLSDDYLVKENKQVKELEQQSASSSSTATTAGGIKIKI